MGHPHAALGDTRAHRQTQQLASPRPLTRSAVVAHASADKQFDYDLVIIGCGVGGHGAALHAVEQVNAHAQVTPSKTTLFSDCCMQGLGLQGTYIDTF